MRYIDPAYENLYDFRYEGGAPINSGSQIPVVNNKYKHIHVTEYPDARI